MAVPKYDEMMVPVLRRIAETPGDAVTSKQLRRFVIDYWGLNDNEVAETISSGFERYANNMLWACTYLKQAKCIESPKKGDLPGHPARARPGQQRCRKARSPSAYAVS